MGFGLHVRGLEKLFLKSELAHWEAALNEEACSIASLRLPKRDTPRPGSFWESKEHEQECRGARGSMSGQQSGLAESEVTHRENGPEED